MAIPEKKPYERLAQYLERVLPGELETGKSRGKATYDIMFEFNREPERKMFTPFVWGGASVSGSGGGGDADADAYISAVIAAGGTTDVTIDAAVDTLFVDLKAAGVYSKLVAFYPLIGGIAASNLINANGNTSYDLSLFGGWVHNTDGMLSNGSDTYGDTSIIPATTLSATDNHSSVLFKDGGGSNGYDGSGPAPYFIQGVKTALEAFNGSAIMSGLGSIPPLGKAFLINVKENNTSAFAAGDFNGGGYSVKSTKTNAATTIPTNSWTIGKVNPSGFYTKAQYWFVTIGNGMTQTEANDLYDVIDAFATAVGRT